MTSEEARNKYTRTLDEIKALEKCVLLCSSLEDKARMSVAVLKKTFLAACFECIAEEEENEEMKQSLKTRYEEVSRDGNYVLTQICSKQHIKATEGTILILGEIIGSLKGTIKVINYYRKSQEIELVTV